MWDPLRPKYPPKKQKPKYLAKKKEKEKTVRQRLGRGTLNTCAKFQGLDSKIRRGHWRLNEIWGFMLEPAGSTSRLETVPGS